MPLIPLFVVVIASCRHQPNDLGWGLPALVKVDSVNPVLEPGQGRFVCPVVGDTVAWENKDVFNPAAVVFQDRVWLLYRAEDTVGRFNGTSRLGLAVSTDGLHFIREAEPVFHPDEDSLRIYEWEGGVEDPRLVMAPDGRFIMTYTAYDGVTARLCVAESDDLHHWRKAGPVLRGRFRDTWSKSGAIVVERNGSDFVARRIVCSSREGRLHNGDCEGHFWMYFGDTDLFMAWSDDLITWQPVLDGDKLLSVLKPRPGMFDSRLVEPGPFACWTPEGIVLVYNGMNLEIGGDAALPAGAYCPGQALFAADDPRSLVDRKDQYLFRPDKPYEISGQVAQVCFAEGLVFFQKRWMLYYGTADSRIAVAVSAQME